MIDHFSIKRKYQETLIENNLRASSVIPVIAFDSDSQLFLCDDNNLGFGFICHPLTGADEKIEQQVNALLNEEYPPNTQMQILLFRSPDINNELHYMQQLRDGYKHPLLSNVITERKKYFQSFTANKMTIDHNNSIYGLGYIYDLKLIISIKIPFAGEKPSQEEYDNTRIIKTKVLTTLDNIKLRPSLMEANHWIRIINTILNWGENAGWRNGPCQWDKNQPLCNQVLDYDNSIEISRDHLKIGKQYIKVLSAKRLPEHLTFGDSIVNVGDLSGGLGGVRQNYIVCTNIIFPDPESEKQKLERRRQFAVNQANGPIVKFVPILLDKKNDFDAIYNSLNDGKKPLKISYHVITFADSLERIESSAMTARNFWRTNRYEIMLDAFIQLPTFINSLPLCADGKITVDLNRHKTLTSKEASTIIPIFGEWKGTGTPHINLLSRNMQLMSFSLHDTGSNMNCVIASQSGSGKSFLTNEIISSYMSEGAQVWVIDVGRSYQKLCESFDGDFLHFGSTSTACLNPFPLVISLDGTKETSYDKSLDIDDDGEEDSLVGLLEAMAAPNQKLTDYQVAALKKTLNKVWKMHYRDTTIDHIQAELLADDDQRIKDIGHQLFAFSSNGSYSRFFSGQNNIKFNNQFTVLELEELKSRKHLQQVVLLQLIYQIQQEMYLGDRNRKKIVIIDEAWDLLTHGDVAKFIESGYRRFRKYGGSVVVITQSINDLFDSPTGRAISENSATTILLGQKPETIESIRKGGKLQLSCYDYDQLLSVHTIPGVYSELFIKSEFGRGVGRLIVNEYQKLLYSTNATDVSQIKTLCDQGKTVHEAISQILIERQANE
ncbi:MAG: type IV secretion system protein TraC [Candidatus Thiodiazotropha endolucinida]|nr:type IV secretion system protein TraC [Candidatus Thiodiazotropha taylori]MCW4225203.1 type IV secretion system protein TraC [Candidatus Thiodiazotropha endolucinida]MCG7880755.1 type IV secretion system protein TraC [Candidatus Thiodiazotropha taylori]MCG7886774.1 type IV secretion system protein TraC [Candidatus Thiodiazotropha taylori]MCG8028162.1 type IV secretion system protein TraC [Candidatus Thiodiazotropha taylori]